jgi:hypothetical protein
MGVTSLPSAFSTRRPIGFGILVAELEDVADLHGLDHVERAPHLAQASPAATWRRSQTSA